MNLVRGGSRFSDSAPLIYLGALPSYPHNHIQRSVMIKSTHAPFDHVTMPQGRKASSLKPQKHTPLDYAAMHNREDTSWLKPQRARLRGEDPLGPHRGFGNFGTGSAALAFLHENRPMSEYYCAENIVGLPSPKQTEPGVSIWTIRANQYMELPDGHSEQGVEPESDEESYEAISDSDTDKSSSSSSSYTTQTE